MPSRTFGMANSIVPTRVSHVRIRLPLRCPVRSGVRLVPVCADQTGDFRFHQGLGEHPNPFPEDITILLLEELANERRQIHSVGPPESSTSTRSSGSVRRRDFAEAGSEPPRSADYLRDLPLSTLAASDYWLVVETTHGEHTVRVPGRGENSIVVAA